MWLQRLLHPELDVFDLFWLNLIDAVDHKKDLIEPPFAQPLDVGALVLTQDTDRAENDDHRLRLLEEVDRDAGAADMLAQARRVNQAHAVGAEAMRALDAGVLHVLKAIQ